MIPAVELVWFAVLAGGWLGWQLLRQNGRLLLRIEALEELLHELGLGDPAVPAGLPIGWPAPEFELPDLSGGRRKLAEFRGQSLLLIFFNPACGFCGELMPKLAALTKRNGSTGHWPVALGDSPGGNAEISRRSSDAVVQDIGAAIPLGGSPSGTGESPVLPSILIVSSGDTEKNCAFFREHRLSCPVLVQKESEVAAAYKANGTPSGYLINADGKIASELAMGA